MNLNDLLSRPSADPTDPETGLAIRENFKMVRETYREFLRYQTEMRLACEMSEYSDRTCRELLDRLDRRTDELFDNLVAGFSERELRTESSRIQKLMDLEYDVGRDGVDELLQGMMLIEGERRRELLETQLEEEFARWTEINEDWANEDLK